MLRTAAVFIAGLWIGQEYGKLVPSVKEKTIETYEKCINSEFYKKIKKDFVNDK